MQALQLVPDTLQAMSVVALVARLKRWKETFPLAALNFSTNQLGVVKDLDVQPEAEAGGGGPWPETSSATDDRRNNWWNMIAVQGHGHITTVKDRGTQARNPEPSCYIPVYESACGESTQGTWRGQIILSERAKLSTHPI